MASGEKGVGEGHTTDEARTTQPRGGKDPCFVHGYTRRSRCDRQKDYTSVLKITGSYHMPHGCRGLNLLAFVSSIACARSHVFDRRDILADSSAKASL